MLKFSVVVPVYNCERYLEECITSVLQQTYANFELVLIDDGSTDRSGIICDNYAKRYVEKIVVKHNTNQGPYYSRLDGISIATGDVIVFLDSDDCFCHDALNLLNTTFSKFSCDMVIYNAKQTEAFPSKEIIHPFEPYSLFEGDGKKLLYRSAVETRCLNCIWLKAVKKQCAQLPDCVPVDCRLKHGEDLLLSVSFITLSSRIVYMNEGIYHYRVTPGSITHGYSRELPCSLKTVHEIFDKLIELWKMPELMQIHNARKVSGWMDIVIMMLKPKSNISAYETEKTLQNLAIDPYFVSAYRNMDKKCLTIYYRILAYCMYKKHFQALIMIDKMKSLTSRCVKKVLRR